MRNTVKLTCLLTVLLVVGHAHELEGQDFSIAISELDANGNGRLDSSERRAALSELWTQRRDEIELAFDLNGDGELSSAERRNAARSITAQLNQGFGTLGRGTRPGPGNIATFDTDGDGTLSAAERTAMREALQANGDRPRGGRGQGGPNFATFDTDGDGTLSAAELGTMRQTFQSRGTTENLTNRFPQQRANRSGQAFGNPRAVSGRR